MRKFEKINYQGLNSRQKKTNFDKAEFVLANYGFVPILKKLTSLFLVIFLISLNLSCASFTPVKIPDFDKKYLSDKILIPYQSSYVKDGRISFFDYSLKQKNIIYNSVKFAKFGKIIKTINSEEVLLSDKNLDDSYSIIEVVFMEKYSYNGMGSDSYVYNYSIELNNLIINRKEIDLDVKLIAMGNVRYYGGQNSYTNENDILEVNKLFFVKLKKFILAKKFL